MTSKDLQSLQQLHYEITMLFSVLFQSIKFLEFDQSANYEQAYLCSLIEKKIR